MLSVQDGRREVKKYLLYLNQYTQCVCVYVSVAQSCSTLRPHGLYSLPGSSVQGILQARVLEWVAISFSRIHTITETKVSVLNHYYTWYTVIYHTFLMLVWPTKSILESIYRSHSPICKTLSYKIGWPNQITTFTSDSIWPFFINKVFTTDNTH